MLIRRTLLLSATAALATPATAAGSFDAFVQGVRADARKAGISAQTLDAAFAGVSPNQKVIERDRRQAEFSMTWQRYRNLVITDQRIEEGRKAVAANRDLLRRVLTVTASPPASSPASGASNPATAPSRATTGWSRRRRRSPGKAGGPTTSGAS